jgi:hypothetical protein
MCIDLHPISTLYGLTLKLEIELRAILFIKNHSRSVRYSIHATQTRTSSLRTLFFCDPYKVVTRFSITHLTN